MTGAEKIRRLDVMLSITAARCQRTASDFTAAYGRFLVNHHGLLGTVDAELRGQLAREGGASGSWRAMRLLNVSAAEIYDRGHPWLDCGQLATAANALAEVIGRETLEEAADQLVVARMPGRMAYAAR